MDLGADVAGADDDATLRCDGFGPRIGSAHRSRIGRALSGPGRIRVATFCRVGGIAYMFGPTGGYLLGFLAMARLVGLLGRPGLESDSF